MTTVTQILVGLGGFVLVLLVLLVRLFFAVALTRSYFRFIHKPLDKWEPETAPKDWMRGMEERRRNTG